MNTRHLWWLLLLGGPVQAELTSITEKATSRYEVYHQDTYISQHNKELKAAESAILYAQENCTVKCEIKITRQLTAIIVFDPINDENAPSSIRLTWDHPTQREDGTALSMSEIAGYTIEHTLNDTPQTPINVTFPANSHTLPYIQGTHRFRIATIDRDGVQGEFTNWIESENG